MKVTIKGKGFIKKHIHDHEIDIKPGTRLSQLPAILSLPEQLPVFYIVNGTVIKKDAEISDGDIITIVSTLSGG